MLVRVLFYEEDAIANLHTCKLRKKLNSQGNTASERIISYHNNYIEGPEREGPGRGSASKHHIL